MWTCESTGRSNLTLSEAMQSEAEATEHLQKMPVPLQRGICYIIHKQEVCVCVGLRAYLFFCSLVTLVFVCMLVCSL